MLFCFVGHADNVGMGMDMKMVDGSKDDIPTASASATSGDGRKDDVLSAFLRHVRGWLKKRERHVHDDTISSQGRHEVESARKSREMTLDDAVSRMGQFRR